MDSFFVPAFPAQITDFVKFDEQLLIRTSDGKTYCSEDGHIWYEYTTKLTGAVIEPTDHR